MATRDSTDLVAHRPRPWIEVAIIAGFTFWVLAAGAALYRAAGYAAAPGTAAPAPTSWPAQSRLARTPGRGALVLVAHTKCACTRATLHELERVMARAGDRAEAFVVFVGPREAATPRSGTIDVLDLRALARGITGVTVVEDEREARLFGAATSGQVVAYDAAGALVFRGGITSARGHEGDSAGNEILRRFVVSGRASTTTTTIPASDVFGCALFDTPNRENKEP